jgi:hypothetical protein
MLTKFKSGNILTMAMLGEIHRGILLVQAAGYMN